MTFRDKVFGFLPYFLLIVGGASSIILWRYFTMVNLKREKEHLQSLADETVYVFKNRLKTYEDAHYAGGALYHATGPISKETWKQWVKSTRLMEIYPGINGIGISVAVDKKDSLSFVRKFAREQPGYPITSMQKTPYAPDMFVIKFIEPVPLNETAIGFDMGSEPTRRKAMELSRKTGKTEITDKVILVQDEKKRPGFLMYVPIYQTIEVPDSLSRKENFVMWVYSPFITADFIKGLVAKELKNTISYISFNLYDKPSTDPDELLYSYVNSAPRKDDPYIVSTIQLYGNNWTLHVWPSQRMRNLYVTNQPTIILIIGMLLTLILSVLVYFMANTRKRAVEMAGNMTEELQKLNVELEKKVEERTLKYKEINWFYESLMQSMHEALLVLDPTFHILKANIRFHELFRADKVIDGLSLTELRNVEWSPVLRDVELSFKNNDTFEKEYLFNVSGIGERYFSITSIPIKQGFIRDQRVLLVISDVTDKKENEQRRNDFIGFVTHELRTPLSNLKAYAQLSERFFQQGKPEESFKLSTKLMEFIDRLQDLVSELHDVTKVTSGKLQINKELFDYNEFIDETIKDATLTYPEYRFIKRGETSVMVEADRYRINQVLTNYISNAVKFSKNQKDVIISVFERDGNIVTSVKDFGPGIPKENMPRVFQRLYRVQKLSKTEGLGLGLYLSREIIRAHGGKVWVESEENIGSEFYYMIPYHH